MIGNVASHMNYKQNYKKHGAYSGVSESNDTSSSGKSHSSIDDDSDDSNRPVNKSSQNPNNK